MTINSINILQSRNEHVNDKNQRSRRIVNQKVIINRNYCLLKGNNYYAN